MRKPLWAALLAVLLAGAAAAEAAELPPDLHETALRRRTRFDKIADLQKSGVLGEDRSGLLSLRDEARKDLEAFVEEENKDREFTYVEVAKLDKTTVEEVRRTFALRFRNQAPAGTPVQNDDGAWAVR